MPPCGVTPDRSRDQWRSETLLTRVAIGADGRRRRPAVGRFGEVAERKRRRFYSSLVIIGVPSKRESAKCYLCEFRFKVLQTAELPWRPGPTKGVLSCTLRRVGKKTIGVVRKPLVFKEFVNRRFEPYAEINLHDKTAWIDGTIGDWLLAICCRSSRQ